MPDNTEPPERDSSPLGHNYCNVINKTQRKQETNMEPEIEENNTVHQWLSWLSTGLIWGRS